MNDMCHFHELPCDDNGNCEQCRQWLANRPREQKLMEALQWALQHGVYAVNPDRFSIHTAGCDEDIDAPPHLAAILAEAAQ